MHVGEAKGLESHIIFLHLQSTDMLDVCRTSEGPRASHAVASVSSLCFCYQIIKAYQDWVNTAAGHQMYKRLRHGFAYFAGRDRALRPALVFRALPSFGVETYGDNKLTIRKLDRKG